MLILSAHALGAALVWTDLRDAPRLSGLGPGARRGVAGQVFLAGQAGVLVWLAIFDS